MEISANMVKELRTATGAGVMDCRKALETAGGDFNRAVEILNEKAVATAAKKSSREAKEGLVGNYVAPDSRVAALVEVDCESDFVARTADFQTLVEDLARMVAAQPNLATPDDLLALPYASDGGKPVKEVINERIAKLGENIVVRRFARIAVEGAAGTIGNYVHMGSKVASLVELDFGDAGAASKPEAQALARNLAMQVVAARPQWLRSEDAPADAPKSDEEEALLEQPYIRDGSKRIKDVVADAAKALGTSVTVRRFARLEVGD